MEKLGLQQNIRRKEQIEAYKEGVANQHSLFGGTVVKSVFNTPDRICFYGNHDYDEDDCFPFFYVMFGTENKLFCGNPGETHNDLMKYVRDGLGDDFTFMLMRNSDGNQSVRGRCFLVDFDAIPKQCVVFTFWKLQDVNLMSQIVYEVCKEKHFFNREIFIANGNKPMIHYNEFTPGDEEIEDNSMKYIEHLLPPEQKHKVTEPYRQIRDKKLGQKLTMSNGQEMPMAQYNALRYVDENVDNSKKIKRIYLTENQVEEIKKELEKARKETNTNPTEGQKEAGNYKMGRVNIYGFEIAIENPKGSYRKGKDKNGKAWKCLMHNDYGYFTHTKAVDGDAVDVFLGKDLDCKTIFAIDQVINGKFDETKIMFGFKTEEEAKKAYLSNYNKGWKGLGKVTEVSIDDFREWLYDGYKQRKPFSEYNEIKKKKLNEMVDFYNKKKLLLGDDGDYIHVIDETFDEVISEYENKDAVPFLTKESIDEFVDDNELGDVLQSFDVQKQLNPKFWINGKLNSRVRLRLLDIADTFFDSMEIDWVKPKDIIMTGSLANYNWSKFSDIDLHIVVDFKEVDDRVEFVKDYFDSKKTIWNNQHEGLKIYGYPVELYVQDESEEHTASGIYSLEKDKWLREPERDSLAAVKLDKENIVHKTKNIIDKIDSLENECEGENDEAKLDTLSAKVKGLFDKIKGMRKESLKSGSELEAGNIIFKTLRRLGYVGKLVDLKRITFDKINSIK